MRPILYSSQMPGGTEDLREFDMAADTSGILVAGDSSSSRSMGAWSPDARRIAYVREFGDHGELLVLDSINGSPRRIGATLPAAWSVIAPARRKMPNA